MNNVGNFSRSLLNYTEPELFAKQLAQQTQKNKDYLEDPIIQELLKNQTTIPKTNPWTTETFEGDAGKFAVPGAAESMDMLPEKMPLQNLGMPGPTAGLNTVRNLTAAIPSALQDIYKTMEQAVTQGPYSSPTGELDPKIVTLPWKVMSPGFARASGLAAFGGKTGPKLGPQVWTKDKVDFLKKVDSELRGTKGSIKETNKRFRERFPDYEGTDSTIQRQVSKMRNWGGANTETGASKVPNPAPSGPKGGSEFELGAFGGRGKLNTESPGEAVNWLQQNQPVTAQWVQEWAKDAGVAIKSVKGKDTKYIKLEGQKRPGDKDVTVRVPQDEGKHIGTLVKPSEPGNLFDTGLGLNKPGGQSISPSRWNESTLINQSGMPYANPQALDAALKWRLSKAPHGQNWLIPEDMAPRMPPKPTMKPMDNYNPYQDPNQLILDILGK